MISAISLLVPPTSSVIRFSSPDSCATVAPAMTPAARPETAVATGKCSACCVVIIPGRTHDEDVVAEATIRHLLFEGRQVPTDNRPNVGIRYRRAGPFNLQEFRQDLD